MVRGLPIAFEVIPTQTFQLSHGLCRTGMQGSGDGGLLRASFTSKGALQGRIHPHRDIALGDGLGPTQHTHQRIEQFVHGLILDGLLRDLHLLAQRGKELEPTQILAQRTKTGPPTLELARFGHGALLLRSGNASCSRAFPSAIRFIGVRFATFSASLRVLLPCAKNWQLWKSGPISGLQGSERSRAFASMASPMVCSVLNHIFMPDTWKRVCPILF